VCVLARAVALFYKPDGRRFDSRFSLEFFIDIILSAILWALGSTEPVTEMSTRNISGGKSGRWLWLTLPPTCTDCHETSWKPSRPVQACTGIALLPLPLLIIRNLLLNMASFYQARKQEVKPCLYKFIAYITRT